MGDAVASSLDHARHDNEENLVGHSSVLSNSEILDDCDGAADIKFT